MLVVVAILFGIAGLVFGSFLNVCIYRIPMGKSIAFPPSACASCGHRLAPMDLVPVLSYLCLHGRCRYCGRKISAVYPIVELLTAALFVGLFLVYSLTWQLLIMLVLACMLVIASFVDIEHQCIPDEIAVGIAVLGVVATLADLPGWLPHIAGILAGGAPLLLIALFSRLVLKKEGMGGGDVKLMAAAGLVIGWKLILFALAAGVILGAVFAVIAIAAKKVKMSDHMPFGPFLAAGILCAVFFGNAFLGWYLALFG